MSNVILSIKNVTKKYGERVAVKNLSFDIFEGEIFGFLGPNGAGKTTTIRMITGLSKIDSGDITICGYSIKKQFQKAVQNIGAIIDNPQMYSNMSGYDNLKYYAKLYKGIKKDRILEVAKVVGLEDRIKDKVKTYSLGMKQRLGIAQAILHHPKLIILDEPTNGLDPEGIISLRQFLRNLAFNEKMAILISSHNLSEISVMCHTVAIINKGKLQEIKSINKATSDGETKVCVKVNFANYAGKLLKQELKIKKVSIIKNSITFNAKKTDIPKITKLLVSNGIEIYSIGTMRRNLENEFLETINKESTPDSKGDK